MDSGVAGDEVGRPPHQRSFHHGIIILVNDPRPRVSHQRYDLCKRRNLLREGNSRGSRLVAVPLAPDLGHRSVYIGFGQSPCSGILVDARDEPIPPRDSGLNHYLARLTESGFAERWDEGRTVQYRYRSRG